MKIFKYILLLFLLAFVGISVFVITQKGDFEISTSQIIHAKKSIVFNYVNEYKNWENWNYWTTKDESTTFNYPGITIGNGGFYSWNNSDGSGSMKTVFVVENDSIFQKMNFNNSESIISWKFKDTIGGTKVILKSSGTMPFLFRIKALLNGSLEKSIKEIYSKNLVNLGNSLDYEINNYSIKVNGFTTNNGGNYMKQTITSKISNLERNIKIMLPRLTRFFKKNKVTMNGSPFIIYNTYDERNGITNFSVCIPIKEEIITSSGSDITSGSLAPYKAIKTTLIGDYSHVQEAWKKTLNYISKNKIPRNNSIPVLEIYKTGVDQERKPSKWVTEIYVAVQATKVIDTVSLKKVTISKPTISNEQ